MHPEMAAGCFLIGKAAWTRAAGTHARWWGRAATLWVGEPLGERGRQVEGCVVSEILARFEGGSGDTVSFMSFFFPPNMFIARSDAAPHPQAKPRPPATGQPPENPQAKPRRTLAVPATPPDNLHTRSSGTRPEQRQGERESLRARR
jgi:hypothetical protein